MSCGYAWAGYLCRMVISGVLLDIDGVLVTSWRPIAGAATALRVLGDSGIPRSFLTNTTSRTRRQIAGQLTELGMPVRTEEVVTAASLAADYIRETYPGARCFLVNSGWIIEDMPGLDLVDPSYYSGTSTPEKPDVVLLGGAGPDFTHLVLSWVYDWMDQGVPVVAMHRSTTWATKDGLRIDTGMYLLGMEQTSGRTATAVGKPAPTGFLVAAGKLGLDPGEMWMVGDDLHGDVLAAQGVGMTGVLVRTGKFRPEAFDRWQEDPEATQPDYVADSIADLPRLLGL